MHNQSETSGLVAVLTAATIALVAGAVIMATSLTLVQIDQIGSFMSGLAGSVAFMWVAAGLFVQGREIAHQRADINLQTEAIRNSAKVANQELCLRLMNDGQSSLVRQLLETLAIYEVVSQAEVSHMQNAAIRGEFGDLFSKTIDNDDIMQRIHTTNFESSAFKAELEEFISRTDSFFKDLEQLDNDGIITRNAIPHMPIAILHTTLKSVKLKPI